VTIWHTGFTEMFNNVIDHSQSKTAVVTVEKTAIDYGLKIADQGMGIFKKIKKALDLTDERHAALELAKGNFTTDPDNHNGMSVFFSYHTFDIFVIVSGKVYFTRKLEANEDWFLDAKEIEPGTSVYLRLDNDSKRNMQAVYDDFSSAEEDDYAFSKTVVPVKLAEC